MRNFKNFRIWQGSMDLVKLIFKLANELPNNERYGLKSQITRAAVSIPSNIAEGSSRNSDKEFKRFVEIAIGSSFELETQLILIKELKYADENEIEHAIEEIHKIQKQTNVFIRKLADGR